MARLTGNIQDVTGRVPESISSVTVKAPTFRLGSGSGIVTSSPAQVDFDRSTGRVDIEGIEPGLSWLYLEGEGWSDSIALAVADGFTTIVEAALNALSEMDFFKNLLKGTAEINDATVLALVMRTANTATRHELEKSFVKLGHTHTSADITDLAAFIGKEIANLNGVGGPIEAYAKNTVTTYAQPLVESAIQDAIKDVTFYQGEIREGSLKDHTKDGWYSVANNTQVTDLPWPNTYGTLLVTHPTPSAVIQNFISYANPVEIWSRYVYRPENPGANWSTWTKTSGGITMVNSDVVDLNDLMTDGVYGIYSSVTKNKPAPGGGRLEVKNFTTTYRVQEYTVWSTVGRKQVFTRWQSGSYSEEPQPWSEWVEQTPNHSHQGMREIMRQRVYARKGVIGTKGKGAVAIRFDDLKVEVEPLIIPLLEKYNIPYSRAITSRQHGIWTPPDSFFGEVQDACIKYGGEIMCHSQTHYNQTGHDKIYAELIESRAELQAKVPRMIVDTHIAPAGAIEYDGLYPFDTVERLHANQIGGDLLDTYAYISGYLPNSRMRQLDGVMKDGGDSASVDSWAVSSVKGFVNKLISRELGAVLYWHPATTDMAKVEEGIAYMAEKRAAGELEILTVTGLEVANSAFEGLKNLLIKRSFSGPFTETWDSSDVVQVEGLCGATFQLRVEVDAENAGTVTTTINDSVRAHDVPSGRSVLYHCYTLPVDATEFTLACDGNVVNAELNKV